MHHGAKTPSFLSERNHSEREGEASTGRSARTLRLVEGLYALDRFNGHPGLELVRECSSFSSHFHASFRTILRTQIPLKPVVLKSGLSATTTKQNSSKKLMDLYTDTFLIASLPQRNKKATQEPPFPRGGFFWIEPYPFIQAITPSERERTALSSHSPAGTSTVSPAAWPSNALAKRVSLEMIKSSSC